MRARVPLDTAWLADFCERWRISELSLFGSALRDDFGPDSDIDILVEFEAHAGIGYFALSRIEDDLAVHFGRNVDVVPKRALRPQIRDEILASREVVIAAA
ncbi:MAG: nucleotidyltransferase family protein [Candidatus Sericytochromatia bacterium]|nr:nucleotidyltransferase family protein [Candidatus Tanganyikabacteria bacterium]